MEGAIVLVTDVEFLVAFWQEPSQPESDHVANGDPASAGLHRFLQLYPRKARLVTRGA